MNNTFECPSCASIVGLPNQVIFNCVCPKCGANLRLRKGRAYRAEEIADNDIYCIVLLFAQIARANPEFFAEFDKFVGDYINRFNLTKSQFLDITKVYQDEKKKFFHEKTKYVVYNLHEGIDLYYKAKPMKEQEAFEDSLFQLFYKMATIGGGPNEEQMKILDMYKLTFGLTDERIANVITEFKKEEKVTREINYKDVFAKIRSELSNMYMTSKDLINNLVVAFERPYLIKNDLNAPKNIITIFTNESELLLELVNVISSMMTEELVIKAGVSRFDCAQYSKDENYVEFANNFIHLLNDQEEVIVIENFKALSSKNTAFLVDLLKNNFTYVDTNDGRAKISCNNKYFVFISMGEPRDFGAIVGDSVFSKIGDVIEVKDFSDEEITRMVANYTNYFVVSCRSELELSLYYDEGLIDFLKQFYSKNIGMRSIKYYIEQNIHKPLVDYKLKMQPTNEQQLTLVVVENEVAVYDEKNVIKLSKFAQKKTNETLEEVKAELNSIIGLNEVKEYVLKLEDNVVARKMREEAGFKNSSISMNMIFTGNPGTGKTTIARIVAEYLKALGVLEKGQLVEVTRGDLVGEHVGETAAKTTAKISSALGGVLFIDEAYSLSRDKNDTFGLEAIDTLVKMMEDNKDNLVVILAGYKAEMEHFLKSNSGLKSRFPNFVEFADYTPKEMYLIADEIAKKNDYIIDNSCIEPLITYFESKNIKGRNDNGNGRLVRNVVEKAIVNQSNRIVNANDGDLQVLKLVDFELKEKEEFDLESNIKDIIGLENVKDFLRKQYNILKAQKMRREAGQEVDTTQSLNMIFTGNPGTGKTTIARVVAKMLKEMGVLKSGHLVETDRRGLVAEYVGQTAVKTEDVFKSALGGVLFIDEAYALASGNDTFGKEAIDTLVKLIEDNRGEIVVILAGYKKEMGEFLEVNSGLTSRFPISIDFPDYNADELYSIFNVMVKQKGFMLDPDAEKFAKEKIGELYKRSNAASGNGRMVRNFLDEVVRNQSSRIVNDDISQDKMTLITKEDLGAKVDEGPTFDYEADFNKIIGLDGVKNYIRGLAAKIKVSKEREKLGLINNTTQTLHMIFMGNPGTGKTMMARTVAKMLYSLGVIDTDKLVETDRAGLVAGYVGQTAIKTTKKVEEALDGVLFIDEAYSLSNQNDSFGKEAIDTLVKLMDDNRDRLVVILAGYTKEMTEFLDANSGLLSRFPNRVEFTDYTLDELMQIADLTFASNGYTLSDGAKEKVKAILDEVRVDTRFGNGRYVRNMFEKAITNQALRISNLDTLDKETLMTVEEEDIEKV